MSAALRITILLVCLVASCLSFAPLFRPASLLVSSSKNFKAQPLFAKKQVVAAPLLDKNGKEFWQGDWVCAGENAPQSYRFIRL